MEEGGDVLNQGDCTLLSGCRVLALHNGGYKTHQGAIASIHSDGVSHQVDLRPVLAGDYSAMRLVPVKDQLAVESLGDNVAVYSNLAGALYWQHDTAEFYR